MTNQHTNNALDKSLLKAYEHIDRLLTQLSKFKPVSLTAKQTAIEAYDYMRCHHYLEEAELLVNLLAKPHIKSLLVCYDNLANKSYEPTLPPVCTQVDEDDVYMNIVNLIKKDVPLGITIRINERNGAVVVTRIMHGESADRSNAINVGDEIQEINGMTVHGRDPMEIVRILTTISGNVKLKLIPSATKIQSSSSSQERIKIYIRALFSYSPSSDSLTPCPEAGLPFLRGDILSVVNIDDCNWWQAYKVAFPLGKTIYGNNMSQLGFGRTGLIPSKTTREWKMQYQYNAGHHVGVRDIQTHEFLSYEEVEKYLPDEGCYRPIVLVGPPRVGKSELVHQLIRTDPEHFREPIRITTQDPNADEVHGRDYLFVTVDEFNTFVEADSLIDSNETSSDCHHYHMTGLCLDAVLEIIQAGKVAVFEADYRNLIQIRTSNLKPFVVFVKPPSLDVLIETRLMANISSENNQDLLVVQSASSTPRMAVRSQKNALQNNYLSARKRSTDCILNSDQTTSALIVGQESTTFFTESQFHKMIQLASRLDVTHGHLWDFVLVNDDLPVALEQLSELAFRIETEACWVPKLWLSGSSETPSSDTNSNSNLNAMSLHANDSDNSNGKNTQTG